MYERKYSMIQSVTFLFLSLLTHFECSHQQIEIIVIYLEIFLDIVRSLLTCVKDHGKSYPRLGL